MVKGIYDMKDKISKYIVLCDALDYAPEVLWTMAGQSYEQLPKYVKDTIGCNRLMKIVVTNCNLLQYLNRKKKYW
jgi:hypothetical protein